MSIELKPDCKWSLVVPTSMGVRLVPPNGQPVHSSTKFTMQATSAESNVASVVSFLGMRVKVLTCFVADSPIARFIRDDLARRHMDVEGPEVPQGGPWGHRHQFNVADSGFGPRGPRVHNDRAGEVGRTLDAKDFDLERLFAEQGVHLLHLSGLIAALSPSTGAFCLELVRAARRHGTRIAFDLNHRASFWQGRTQALGPLFHEIAGLADILVGNEEDFQLCLGLDGPEAGGGDLSGKLEAFKDMIAKAGRAFPGTSAFATTLREVQSADSHLWGAVLRTGGNWHVVEPRPIGVFDRIGGGDGFVGGLLYACLKGWEPRKWVQFGWACGALAAASETDYAQPLDEDEVWSIWSGNARVRR